MSLYLANLSETGLSHFKIKCFSFYCILEEGFKKREGFEVVTT